MENNLITEAIDKIKSHKVDIPNIAIVLGSGLGNFIHWIENPTFVNFEEIPGLVFKYIEESIPLKVGSK